MKKILCMDSDYDDITSAVADWRKKNLYPGVEGNGHAVERLEGTMAVRAYLLQDLAPADVSFFTASGHGLPDEYQGSDGSHALKVNDYPGDIVKGKIIHLLSCNTAQELGIDTVKKGCLAFFGYDLPFSFYYDQMDIFMRPDASFVQALASGQTAKQAFDLHQSDYRAGIKQLTDANADLHVIADMQVNFDHFRSPFHDKRWGSQEATIN